MNIPPYTGASFLYPSRSDASACRRQGSPVAWAQDCVGVQASRQVRPFDTHSGNEPAFGSLDMRQIQAGTHDTGNLPRAWAQDFVSVSSGAPEFHSDMANSDLISGLGLGRYLDEMPAEAAITARLRPQLEAGLLSSVNPPAVPERLHQLGRAVPNKTKVNREMLIEWIRLARWGMLKAGGAAAAADRFGVSPSTIYTYIRGDGSLRPLGERMMVKDAGHCYSLVTPKLLHRVLKLGREGISQAGGLVEIAAKHNVPASTLRCYVRSDARLTEQGVEFMNEAHEFQSRPAQNAPTGELQANMTNSQMVERLGLGHYLGDTPSPSKTQAEPLAQPSAGPSSVVEVPSSASRSSVRGNDSVVSDNGITRDMLQAWIGLGPRAVRRAGGAAMLARELGVKFSTIRNYVLSDGTLTPRGERLMREDGGESFKPITAKLLQTLSAMGKSEVRRVGGLAVIASQYHVSHWRLRHYMRADGSLTQHGVALVRQSPAIAQQAGQVFTGN